MSRCFIIWGKERRGEWKVQTGEKGLRFLHSRGTKYVRNG